MSRSLSWLAKNVVLDLVDRARQMGVSRLSEISMRSGLRLIKCAALALVFWTIVLAGVGLEAWRPIAWHFWGLPTLGIRWANEQVIWSSPLADEKMCRWIKTTNVGDGNVACTEVGGRTRLVVRDSGGILVVGKDGELALAEEISSDKYRFGSILEVRHILNFEDQRRRLFEFYRSDGTIERPRTTMAWSKAEIDQSQVVLAAKELAGLAPMSDASLPWLGEESHIGSADGLGLFIACLMGNSVFGWFFLLTYLGPVVLAWASLAYVVSIIKGSSKQQVVLAAIQVKQGLSNAWGWVSSCSNRLAMLCAGLSFYTVAVGLVMVIIGALYPWTSSGNETPAVAPVDSCRLDVRAKQARESAGGGMVNAVCRREGDAYMIMISQSPASLHYSVMDVFAKENGFIPSQDGVIHVSAKTDLAWRGGDAPTWSLRSWREYWGFAPITEASRSWGLSMRTKVGENAGWSLSGVASFGSVLSAWAMEGWVAFPHVFLTWILLPCVGLAISAWVVKSIEGVIKSAGRKAMGSAPVNEFISRAEARELERLVKKAPKSESSARGRL